MDESGILGRRGRLCKVVPHDHGGHMSRLVKADVIDLGDDQRRIEKFTSQLVRRRIST